MSYNLLLSFRVSSRHSPIPTPDCDHHTVVAILLDLEFFPFSNWIFGHLPFSPLVVGTHWSKGCHLIKSRFQLSFVGMGLRVCSFLSLYFDLSATHPYLSTVYLSGGEAKVSCAHHIDAFIKLLPAAVIEGGKCPSGLSPLAATSNVATLDNPEDEGMPNARWNICYRRRGRIRWLLRWLRGRGIQQ